MIWKSPKSIILHIFAYWHSTWIPSFFLGERCFVASLPGTWVGWGGHHRGVLFFLSQRTAMPWYAMLWTLIWRDLSFLTIWCYSWYLLFIGCRFVNLLWFRQILYVNALGAWNDIGKQVVRAFTGWSAMFGGRKGDAHRSHFEFKRLHYKGSCCLGL